MPCACACAVTYVRVHTRTSGEWGVWRDAVRCSTSRRSAVYCGVVRCGAVRAWYSSMFRRRRNPMSRTIFCEKKEIQACATSSTRLARCPSARCRCTHQNILVLGGWKLNAGWVTQVPHGRTRVDACARRLHGACVVHGLQCSALQCLVPAAWCLLHVVCCMWQHAPCSGLAGSSHVAWAAPWRYQKMPRACRGGRSSRLQPKQLDRPMPEGSPNRSLRTWPSC